ncbi:MAG: carbonic anhydrase family protein [Deltaproteobacteria bacterium]|nr:carbonic anhydrase family protein [Deltaproteobacteria bacterium]
MGAPVTLRLALCAAMLSGVAAADAASWGYEGAKGPARWGSLHPAFSDCAKGAEQSPIDLAGAEARRQRPIDFDYATAPVVLLNNGHAIQVNYAPGSGMTLDGVRYELLQFHFHHGSEHTVAGVRLPMELHLVHRSNKGALAVVGVLLKEGRENHVLAPIWRHMPARRARATVAPASVDATALLPEERTAWRYRGSLTTPPCTQGVSWVVMTEPVEVSAEQIARYGAIFPNSYRPTQPLNRRSLTRDR